jgi:stage IV sporulation protein B
MKRMKVKFISVICLIVAVIACMCAYGGTVVFADENCIYLGGMPAGFTMTTKGAHVVGLCDVVTDEGVTSPSKYGDIRVGDIIIEINGTQINNAKDIEHIVKNTQEISIKILRSGQIFEKRITPSKDLNGNVKLGVFIKDSISGVGTVTFIKNGKFASLGHAVIDENNNELDIIDGNIYSCSIKGVVKGERGAAGELKGVFLRDNPIGKIEKNTSSGVYGSVTNKQIIDKLIKIETGEAKVGSAKIVSTVEGKESKEYDISIVKCDFFGENKNFVIKIADEKLLNITGGIVQGMSGSPIIQNGKLVGAVTHVFINDPTRGFGISINNMIENIA